MTGLRLVSILAAVFVSLLLDSSVQAAPRVIAQATAPSSGQDIVQPAPSLPPPQPYYPPQPPGPYSQPAPGYPPSQYGYPPSAAYPQPYYLPPVDMRPAVLDYDPDKPIPPGYRLESSARKGFVVSGSIIFGISYGIALLVAASSTESSSSYSSSSSNDVPFNNSLLYIPVLGPWLALATVKDTSCSSSSTYYYSCDNSDASDWKTLLVVGGVTQTLGAGFIILGLASRYHQLVLTEHVRASVLPVQMGRTGQGLAMVGSFSGL